MKQMISAKGGKFFIELFVLCLSVWKMCHLHPERNNRVFK